jgi:serine protease Do
MARRWSGRLAVAALVPLLVAACGGGSSKVVVRTVTASSTVRSFPSFVGSVRSGVIRIQTTTCDSQEVGTGFLLSPRLVATVEHVVDGATRVVLRQNGVTVATGAVIGADQARDVALVRTSKPIRGYVFKIARRPPALGERVAAFGFPFGLPLTVTQGSVSGLDRAIPIDNITRRHLVQTDAAVNPGNSGGPLVTTDTHEVVGLVDLGTNQANGLAFAVSASVARPLLQAWKATPQPIADASCGGSSLQAASPAASPASAPDPTDTLYAYWALLQSGAYRQAYNLFSPAEQRRVQGLKAWLAYYTSDPVASVSNANFTLSSTGGDQATVDVDSLQTVGAASGCRNWAGSYSLIYQGGAWLIDYASLSYTPC